MEHRWESCANQLSFPSDTTGTRVNPHHTYQSFNLFWLESHESPPYTDDLHILLDKNFQTYNRALTKPYTKLN